MDPTLRPSRLPDSQPRLFCATSGADVVRATADAVLDLQAGDPLAEVMVVTPPGATADTLRRVLPSQRGGRGVSGVRFTTPIDVANQYVERVDGPRTPVTPQLLAAAVSHVLDNECPPDLTPISEHPSTLDAIVTCAEQLRFVPFHRAEARTAIDDLAGSSRARRGVLDVAIAARVLLQEHGYDDETASLERAVELIDEGRLGPPPRVVVVASTSFSPGQIPTLTALNTWCADQLRVVCPTSWATDDGVYTQVSAILGEPVTGPDSQTPPTDVYVSSCPDHDEEVRHVVRQIAATQLPLDRIAVLVGPDSGYRRSLTDLLDQAEIPWAGYAPHTLGQSLAGTVLRLLIDLTETADRQALLGLFAAAPDRTSADEPRRDLPRWRQLSRSLGLVSLDDLAAAHERLDEREAAHIARSREAGRAPNLTGYAHDRTQLDAMLALAATVLGHIRPLDGAPSWGAATSEITTCLVHLLGDETWRSNRWADLPEWQFTAATQVLAGVEALSSLDHARLHAPYSVTALHRQVARLLERPLGRQTAVGAGVRLHDHTDGVCIDADHVFWLGAVDGALPGGPSDRLFAPTSPDHPAARLVEHNRWRPFQVERAWWAVLRGPARVDVTWPRADMRRGGELFASRLITDYPTHPVTTHADGVLHGHGLHPSELLCRHALDGHTPRTLQRRVQSIVSRRRETPTAFDGQLGPGALDPAVHVHSISAMETLATCGISYLYRYVLGVYDEDDPAEVETISARDRGTLIHAVLEDIAATWLTLPAPRPAWLSPAHTPDISTLVDAVIASHETYLVAHGLVGNPARWAIDRSLIHESICDALRGERAAGSFPLSTELAFGFDDPHHPPHRVDTPVGQLTFRGKIDRIDQVGDRVRVTDFKTTTSKSPPTMRDDDPTNGGTKLQLPLYLDVATVTFSPHGSARYLYLSPQGIQEAVMPTAATDHARIALEQLAARLHEGDLRPGEPGTWGCRDCAPDHLGLEHVTQRATALAKPIVFTDDNDNDNDHDDHD